MAYPLYFDAFSGAWVIFCGLYLYIIGMPVCERNGNVTTYSGRELFGDNTLKSNGQLAADGFDALADLDTNGDGIVNASDTNFNNLRIWRDLNQNGISQSNELFTLTSLGIAGINVAIVYPYIKEQLPSLTKSLN